MVQPGTIALGITGILAAALVVHGFGMRYPAAWTAAPTREVRAWDKNHPDKAIGKYDLTRDEAKAACEKSSRNANAKAVESDEEEGR